MLVADKRGADYPPLSARANMLWNSAGSIVYLACQWMVTILVVRLSSSYDAAGLLSLAMSVVGTFATFANYKMGTYQVSDIKRENSTTEYLGFRLITLGMAFVGCMAYALITCPLGSLLPIVLYFIFKAVGLVIDILHGLDQLNRRMDFIGKSFILQGFSTLAAFVLVFWLTQSLNWAIVSMTVAVLGVLVLFDVPHSRAFEQYGVRITIKKAVYLLKRSFSAVLAGAAGSALFAVPKQYLLARMGDAALGIYSSVAAPALIVQMGATYLYVPLLDVFPRYYLEGNKGAFLKLLARTVAAILLVGALCYGLFGLIGEWALLLLFGESIAPYAYLLQPVIIASIATAFLWFFGDLLITVRCFKGNFWGNIVAFAAIIPLSVFCVDQWGMNGVSFAGAIASLIGALVMLFFLAKSVKDIPTSQNAVEDDENDITGK
ncbi:lipopolysaccharide biosynthesis protein [Adlercreutzia mucosicola]|uniref:lipopolysaccharide biosynthesis protein n=1 Tax=Adlercreutzia mucosicola TaxID=580026 RepID=UPI000687152E|nr:polysaccharide biosynthesis protein [Adlercreutzia mucosicola]MCR2034181.1 polysaccharide biosynthesis protein [Adlercreutzia mucosicola]